MKDQNGFTLIEATIVMAITAILLCFGIPALTQLSQRTQLTAEHNRFMGAINYARQLAVDTSSRVVLCPSESHQECLEQPEWHRGWMIFVDDNKDRERDPGETIYLVGNRSSEGYSVTSSSHRRRIAFRSDGMAYGANVTLRLCPPDREVEARSIIVSNTGRARSATIPWQQCGA